MTGIQQIFFPLVVYNLFIIAAAELTLQSKTYERLEGQMLSNAVWWFFFFSRHLIYAYSVVDDINLQVDNSFGWTCQILIF